MEMKMFDVRVEADSIAPCGKRLTTIVCTYPRFIHSEIMTHRDRARNSASSRAIPWPKMKQMIEQTPVVPIRFGSEQKGMQTGGEIKYPEAAEEVWLKARDAALKYAQELADMGVHKSIVNRLTEPFMWITVVMTATEWNNFFRLRCHPDAEIHFQKIATMIRDALNKSTPIERNAKGEPESWHMPFILGEDWDWARNEANNCVDTVMAYLKKISVARCARVSYLTHDGRRDPLLDLDLFERLVQGSGFGHFSPHEHVAEACQYLERSGPFIGWRQFRKTFPSENQVG